ncbi:MAG: hypothetical protein QS748_10795 [Candidatus Endonucleobacter bathymodioli]|uniref:Uncharacterized protein n=1 Tax=Candidatus Endonucleibacter bathymodioli TaxID=539814 RepID=A0AA90NSB5_9GAMM|nr:hypothetical protein [Candidatus Endonucleobacter bathymodioli]
MYAGFLNGASHFANYASNIINGNPDQVPPMAEQPFIILQMPQTPHAQPIQVPIQSLAPHFNTLPSNFGLGASMMYDQMMAVCYTQLLQLEHHVAALQNQFSALCQSQISITPHVIPPFMIPMPQVMANIQGIGAMEQGVPPANLPPLQGYPVQTLPSMNTADPLGQFYFQPTMRPPLNMSSLTTRCPDFRQTPMQSMPGFASFSSGLNSFIPPHYSVPQAAPVSDENQVERSQVEHPIEVNIPPQESTLETSSPTSTYSLNHSVANDNNTDESLRPDEDNQSQTSLKKPASENIPDEEGYQPMTTQDDKYSEAGSSISSLYEDALNHVSSKSSDSNEDFDDTKSSVSNNSFYDTKSSASSEAFIMAPAPLDNNDDDTQPDQSSQKGKS